MTDPQKHRKGWAPCLSGASRKDRAAPGHPGGVAGPPAAAAAALCTNSPACFCFPSATQALIPSTPLRKSPVYQPLCQSLFPRTQPIPGVAQAYSKQILEQDFGAGSENFSLVVSGTWMAANCKHILFFNPLHKWELKGDLAHVTHQVSGKN